MVVRLFFTDGSSVVRTFTNDELFFHEILDQDKLTEYFENNLDLQYPVESWDFTNNSHKKFSNIYRIDLREIINDSQSLVGVEIENRVVDRFEWLDEGSYEFSLACLENSGSNDLYYRNVLFDFDYANNDLEHWDHWEGGSEYDDE
jgi:hypothetical protein